MENNPEDAPSQECSADQGMAAVQVVQALVAESVKTAMSGITQELLEAVDRRIAAHADAAATSTAHRTSGESGRGVASLPSGGQLPPTVSLASMPVVPTGAQPATVSSGRGTPSSSLTPLPHLSSTGNEAGLSPTTPLSSLLPLAIPSLSNEAVAVGTHSPPVPKKVAEKIWGGEFIELSELLPSRLGAPELTLRDLVANRDKQKEPKKITTIQQWVVCFNAYTSVMAVRHPGRIQDLLAYASTITKASLDYEGTPWLSYDSHFRRVAAAAKLTDWSQVDASLWTLYFTSARLSHGSLGGLAVISSPQKEVDTQRKKVATPKGLGATQRSRYSPYPPRMPICKNWNYRGCTEASCRFRHMCIECHSPSHTGRECPDGWEASSGEQRSKTSGKPFQHDGPKKGR